MLAYYQVDPAGGLGSVSVDCFAEEEHGAGHLRPGEVVLTTDEDGV